MKFLLQLFAWNILNPYLLRKKRRQKHVFPSHFKGINIGCGADNPNGWMGVDGGFTIWLTQHMKFIPSWLFRRFNMSRNFSKEEYVKKLNNSPIIHHDLQAGLPFSDNCIPAIYSSHFFEHIVRPNAEQLIKECYRVLKPGGKIRICVPSLDEEAEKMRNALRAYESGDINPMQRFVTNHEHGFISEFSTHKWMYSGNDLCQLLTQSGFSNVKVTPFRESEFPDVNLLDIRGGLHVDGEKSI